MSNKRSKNDLNKSSFHMNIKGVNFSVDVNNHLSWMLKYDGYIRVFLEKKVEQFYKNNSDYEYIISSHSKHCNIVIDFDTHESKFFALVDNNDTKYYLGRKVNK